MVKAIVAGASGRMGKRIISIISETEGIELVGAFERGDHPDVGKDAGIVAGVGKLGIEIKGSFSEVLDKGDVLIDFTVPEATYEHVRAAAEKGISMVIGTTALSDKLLDEIKEYAKKISCVLSPNMSIGVNVMFKIVKELSKILAEDYDVEIVELHHRFKKDAPSGTALRIAQIIAETKGISLEKTAVYGRKGIVGERSTDELGIHAVRAGDITGEHIVIFGGMGERIELIHRAHSRDNFARGAVKAAMWVVNQPPGLYDMQDVLGLK
ncbi:MAG: 4-hydroxy-tetrahydrodipicolinate reductase [Deltaproteobacteria bacterium]|nr:MAG: 4-hydroxy-tetrahydrodipicolinate reductase [Deltaproteobacteria bacterium]